MDEVPQLVIESEEAEAALRGLQVIYPELSETEIVLLALREAIAKEVATLALP
jgi:hypothetical protein